jgi:hypothetical protein
MLDRTRLAYAVFAFALGAAMTLAPASPVDFDLFWYLGGHPGSAYDLEVVHRADFARLGATVDPGGYLPFGYPPPLLLLLAPLHLVPLHAAKMLWSGGWCAAFVFIASRDTRWATPLLALSLPLLWCSAIGQTGVMVATLVVAGFQQLDERPHLAGVLLGIAACFKPQALLLAPIVLWGRWPVVRAAILAAAAAALASLVFGPSLWLEWLRLLPRFTAIIGPTFLKVSPPYLLDGVAWRLVIGAVGLWFAWRERNLTGLLVGNLLCNPYLQYYDLAGLSYLGARSVANARRVSASEVVLGVILTVCVAWPVLTTIYCAALIGVSLHRSWAARRAAQAAAA